ncbi:MAG: alpha/beta hydrolase [Muribaculaceae bacterium]|nr:alpha/beta hydrolase [Muribaculaceae bacterium]
MEKFLELDNGMRVKYDLIGDGPAIILMHGWGCQSSTLNSIANIAAEQHTVYNLDLPGFGKSDEPREVWGVDEYARMLEEFVSKLGIENPIVLGHSYGGRIGILYSSRNSVDKLILVDAAGIKPKRSLKYYFKVYSFKAGKHLTRLFLGKVKAEERIEAMRKKKGSSDYAGSSQMMRAVMSKSVNQDLKYAMPAIKAPTLLIWGENDTATPLRDAKIMEKLIPDAGLVSFLGCGHYSFLDNPHQFAAVLRSFINR